MQDKKIVLYGANWCPKTSALRNYLQSKWIDFQYLDVEDDKEAEQTVRNMFDGKLKFPVLVIGDEFFKNPGIGFLNEKLPKL